MRSAASLPDAQTPPSASTPVTPEWGVATPGPNQNCRAVDRRGVTLR